MIKRIDELTLEEINDIDFLNEKEIKQLTFAELCIYQEQMNKVKARYMELTKNEGEGM